MKSLSRAQLLATAWTAAHQASPSMRFSRQEYWSEVPLPSLKWTGMGELNSNGHYIYYCGQESLGRNGVALIAKKETEMQYLDAVSKMT